jgi:hypothetical protein
MAVANWHSDLHDLGISLEQVIDHSATTSRVDREISVTFSSAVGGQRNSPPWPTVRHTSCTSTR